MASAAPEFMTGFTASMDGVSNAGVFIPMRSQSKIEDGASLSVKSYNITANTANSNENATLSNIQILENEEVNRVDYNKRKIGPVTVKSYTVDDAQSGGYQLTLQGVEEYMTQDVPLDELINSTKSAMYLRYGGRIDIIDSDAFIDGETYERMSDIVIEIAEFNNGYVSLSSGGHTIDEINQGTLTGYDIANEKFNSTAAGTVISIIGFYGEG